jgi:hypothetical protein
MYQWGKNFVLDTTSCLEEFKGNQERCEQNFTVLLHIALKLFKSKMTLKTFLDACELRIKGINNNLQNMLTTHVHLTYLLQA